MAFTGEAILAFDADRGTVYRPVVLTVHPRDDRSCVLSFKLNGCIELAKCLLGGGDPVAFEDLTRTVTWPAVSFSFGTAWEYLAFQKLFTDCERVFGMRQLQETLERDVGIPVEALPSYQPLPRDWLPTHPRKQAEQQRAAAASGAGHGNAKRGASASASGAASAPSIGKRYNPAYLPAAVLRPEYCEAASLYVAAMFRASAAGRGGRPAAPNPTPPAALLKFFGAPVFNSTPDGPSLSGGTCHACHKSSIELVLCNRSLAAGEDPSARRPKHGVCRGCLAKRIGVTFEAISSGSFKYCCVACAGICACANCKASGFFRGPGSGWVGNTPPAAPPPPSPAPGQSPAQPPSSGSGSSSAAAASGRGKHALAPSSSSTLSSLPPAVAAAVAKCPGVRMPLTEGTECILDCMPARRNKLTGKRVDSDDEEEGAQHRYEEEEEDDYDEDGQRQSKRKAGGKPQAPNPNAPCAAAKAPGSSWPRIGISYQWRFKYSRADLGTVWSVLGATPSISISSSSSSSSDSNSAVNAHFLPLMPLPSAEGIMLASHAAAAAVGNASGRGRFGGASGAGVGAASSDELLTAMMMMQTDPSAAGSGGGLSMAAASSLGLAMFGADGDGNRIASSASPTSLTSGGPTPSHAASAANAAAATATGGGASAAAAALTGIGVLGLSAATLANMNTQGPLALSTPLGRICTAVSAFSHRKCIMCACVESRASSRRRIVGLHPLVPVKQCGTEGVWTCERCHATILGRRQVLASRGQLLDENDGYETCCALCGHGGPALQASMRLTCCSAPRCPRSYCRTCIELLLTPREMKVMEEDPDWRCPPCKAYTDVAVAAATGGAYKSSSAADFEPSTAAAAAAASASAGATTAATVTSKGAAGVGGKGASKSRGQTPAPPSTKPSAIDTTAPGAGVGSAAAGTGSFYLQGSPNPSPSATAADPAPSGKTKKGAAAVVSAALGSSAPSISSSASASSSSSSAPSSAPSSTKAAARDRSKNGKKKEGAGEASGSAAANTGGAGSTSTGGKGSSSGLVPVASNFDPAVYFAHYAKSVRRRCAEPSKCLPTEDECFVCRDGGDVFECDYTHTYTASSTSSTASTSDRCRCTKVYHADCLGYSAPEDKKWECPRHRCRDCAGKAVAVCRYCPNSLCQSHLDKLNKAKAGAIASLLPSPTSSLSASDPLTADTILIPLTEKRVRTPDLPPATQVMVCSHCRALRDEAVARGLLTHDPAEDTTVTPSAMGALTLEDMAEAGKAAMMQAIAMSATTKKGQSPSAAKSGSAKTTTAATPDSLVRGGGLAALLLSSAAGHSSGTGIQASGSASSEVSAELEIAAAVAAAAAAAEAAVASALGDVVDVPALPMPMSMPLLALPTLPDLPPLPPLPVAAALAAAPAAPPVPPSGKAAAAVAASKGATPTNGFAKAKPKGKATPKGGAK